MKTIESGHLIDRLHNLASIYNYIIYEIYLITNETVIPRRGRNSSNFRGTNRQKNEIKAQTDGVVQDVRSTHAKGRTYEQLYVRLRVHVYAKCAHVQRRVHSHTTGA